MEYPNYIMHGFIAVGVHADSRSFVFVQSVLIYSQFETCKQHEVDLESWLTDTLDKINGPEFEGLYSDLMLHRRRKQTPDLM